MAKEKKTNLLDEYRSQVEMMDDFQLENEWKDLLKKIEWHEESLSTLKKKKNILEEYLPDGYLEMLGDGDDPADSYRSASDF